MGFWQLCTEYSRSTQMPYSSCSACGLELCVEQQVFAALAGMDAVDSRRLFCDSPNESRFHKRWPLSGLVRACSSAVPAQMDDRGRKMVTRVRTLDASSGTIMMYWRTAKRADSVG